VNRTYPVTAFCLLLAASAAAQTTPAAPEGPVTVTTGEGSVKRPPDRAWVQVSVESRAKSPREAQKLNADAMSAVLQKVKGAGLSGDAIQTRGYDLQPEFDYNNGRQTLRGYVARNSVELRVDDLPRLGELLEQAVSSGATSVSGVRFDLKDRASAARRRADAAASGAGMRIERVVRIEEHRVSVSPPPRPMMAMRAEIAQAAAEPPIEAGELEVRSAVTLTAAMVRQ